MKRISAYLASPLGFSDAGLLFLKERLIPAIWGVGLAVHDPWNSLERTSEEVKKINETADFGERISKLRIFNDRIAGENEEMIEKSDIMVAVLDGTDVDSGVAAEIGLAYARGMRIVGYRGDFRVTGDNHGATVNLQVEYFINRSGGEIASSIKQLEEILSSITGRT